MKLYLSSMYIHDKIQTFDELVNKVPPRYIELFLDTNLCILLRDFYREPQSIVNRPDNIWDTLRDLLKYIEIHDLIVDYSLGIEEACRNKNDFSINRVKVQEMTSCIGGLFSLSYFEMLEHSKLIKFTPPVKDTSSLKDSKLDSLESNSSFQSLLFVNYSSLLKLLILDKQTNKTTVEKMIEYVDFLDNGVNLVGGANLLFGYHYFGGSSEVKKLIHKLGRDISKALHAIWNASIDLTFPTLVSQTFGKNNTVPIFVTADEKLYQVFDSMKMRVMIRDGTTDVLPPFIEINLREAGWSNSDFNIIDRYVDRIQHKRKMHFIENKFNKEDLLDSLRVLCFKLENEIKGIW
ncbi:hypothetical protein [Paenibacillus tuaregi]|uniref:hypothetical protein n=1 Tax=Paenibacillus tuaregi TaxID=1816681 RepID=UPI000838D29A|nr:hypothetical protein [Paenibacillus tuaregi]